MDNTINLPSGIQAYVYKDEDKFCEELNCKIKAVVGIMAGDYAASDARLCLTHLKDVLDGLYKVYLKAGKE